MKHKTFLLLAILLNLYGCSKEPVPQLPPATHNGTNILACKVNGQVYIATGFTGGVFVTALAVTYSVFSDSTAVINGAGNSSLDNNMGTPDFSLGLSSYYYGIGTYSIIPTTWSPEGGVYDQNYTTSNTMTGGYITYTYNDGNILAGTFAFDAADSSGKLVHITEGRFDIAHL